MLAKLITASACLLIAAIAQATTWIVSPDGSGDALTIQAAVDLCVAGDIVQLEHGVYLAVDGVGNDPMGHGDGRPVCVAMKSGVTLRGDLLHPDLVVLDAGGAGGVVFCASVTGVALEGLTIANGSTSVVWNGSGGGIYCSHSDVVIKNCRVIGNSSPDHGGGLHAFRAVVSIVDCAIEGNYSAFTGSGAYFADSIVLVEGTCVSNNRIINGGALPMYSGGGGFYFSESNLQIVRCSFESNVVDSGGGGGVNCYSGNTGTIESSIFENNQASWGGALRIWSNSNVSIVNCSVHSNEAWTSGGALSVLTGSDMTIFNTDFENNYAQIGSEGFVEAGCTIILKCCLVEPSSWDGPGDWTLNNEGCVVSNEQMTWGSLKYLYK